MNSEYPLETEIPDHLKELHSTNCQEFDVKQQIKLWDLLIKHQGVFSASSHDLGRTSLVEHKVDLLPCTRPIKLRPYRIRTRLAK